jgi:hypothetical protein
MYNLHHRLWIAVSLSTLLMSLLGTKIAASSPVRGKLQPKVIVSQTDKVSAADDISRLPVDAVLDSVKIRSSNQSKSGRTLQRQGANSGSAAKVSRSRTTKTGRHISADRSLQGISNLTDIDRGTNRSNSTAAVSRLIE